MASIIRIKRSSVSGNPSTLGAGELAYSALTDNGSNGGDRLYIGIGSETAGNAANHYVIGGKYFTDMLDQTPGVLTASSALVVDSNKKLDDFLVDNLELNGNTISSTDTNGNILITPNGTGKTVITNAYIGDTSTTLAEYIYDTVGGAVTGTAGQIVVTNSDAGNTSTISLATTAVTAGSYGSATAIPTFTVDAYGRLTAAGTASISTTLSIAGDTGTDSVALGTDTITFVGGTGITSSVTAVGSATSVTFDIDNTVATLTGTQTLTNKTLTSPSLTTPAIGSGGFTIAGSSSGTVTVISQAAASGTLTLPNGADTLVGRATTDTLTNKSISFGSNTITMTSAQLATAVSDETGSGSLVFATSPTLVTPTLGVATATSINKVAITAPATSATLTIADGKTLTASNTLTFTGTDTSSVNFGAGGTVAYTGSTLAQFASTTSLQLAGVISDETGSGSLVFATSPTLVTPVLGAATATSITATSGNLTIAAASGNNSVNITPTGTGTVDVGSKRITSVAEPTQATDAATKNYVDAVKTGLDVKDSVRVATTAALTATYSNGTSGVGATLTNSGTQAAITIDSIVLSVGDRVLVKDQSTALQNGFYKVTTAGSVSTNWVLTRSTDADESAEVTPGAFTFVEEGTAGGNNGYVCTNTGSITIGTTAISFVQFSGAGQVIAGDGLTKTGNTINVVGTSNRITANADSIDISASYVGQTSITTLGTIGTGTWNGSVIGAAYGGTGVANNSANTITFTGNYSLGLTLTANTSVTLPTSGTLATLAGTETFTNKTLTSPTINGGALSGTFSGAHTLSGVVTLSNTTDATSTTAAGVIMSGGLAVAKAMYVGTNITGAGAGTSTLDGFNIDGGTY
jgi:hypothetical protein